MPATDALVPVPPEAATPEAATPEPGVAERARKSADAIEAAHVEAAERSRASAAAFEAASVAMGEKLGKRDERDERD
jgi:hypothetical protein